MGFPWGLASVLTWIAAALTAALLWWTVTRGRRAAAEAVAPVLDDLVRTLLDLGTRLEREIQTQLTLARHRAQDRAGALPALMLRVQRQGQRLDDLAGRLGSSVKESLSTLQQRLTTCRHGLGMYSPLARVKRALVLVPQLLKRMEQRMLGVLAFRRQGVRSLAATLDSLSPLAILARGYSIVQTIPGGAIVKRAQDVSVGDQVRARLAEGQLLCHVQKVMSDP